MEHCTRALAKALLIGFALLLALALLLGACRPAHLSYPAAFSVSVALVALYALYQRRPRLHPSLWQRLGEGKTCALLLCVCLAVNTAAVLLLRVEPAVDYATFWQTAQDIARGETLSLRAYLALFPHILGYAHALGQVIRVFGAGALVAPLFNVCLTTLTGLFLFRLTLRYRTLNSAAMALLGWSLCPSVLLYNTMVLSEPWYTCLLMAFFWLCSEIESKKPAIGFAVILGLFGGGLLRLVNMARPIAAVPLIALVIWVALLRPERGREPLCRWLAFLLGVCVVYAMTGPLWTAWEREALGEAPASVPGYSFYVGLNPETLGSYSDDDMGLLMHYRFELPDVSAETAQQMMLEEAKVRLHYGDVPLAKQFFIKLRTFLGNDEGGAYYARASLTARGYAVLAALSNIVYYALGILALWGIWRLFRAEERRAVLLLVLYVLGLTLAQELVEVAARYHYSVLPTLYLLAAFSLTRPTRFRTGALGEAQR